MRLRDRMPGNVVRLRLFVVVLAVLTVAFALLWGTQTDFRATRWGTIAEGVAALGATALLIFEIARVNVLERRARVLSARRVHAWLEPSQWTTVRQGVTVTHPAGWLLVVANDTDDVVVEWAATAMDASGRQVATAGSSRGDGSLPPRRPLKFELPNPQNDDTESLQLEPRHDEFEGVAEIRFRDRDGQVWFSPGDGSIRASASGGTIIAPSGVPGARRLGPRGFERPGVAKYQSLE